MEIRFAFGSLLTIVLFGSGGSGLPDALLFFWMMEQVQNFADEFEQEVVNRMHNLVLEV